MVDNDRVTINRLQIMQNIAVFLSQNVLALRRSRRLSQQQLSNQSGIPRSTISHIESGAGNPTLDHLNRLSLALGVGLEELISSPRDEVQLIREEKIPLRSLKKGAIRILQLLPDKVHGLAIEQMVLKPSTTHTGRPHLQGAREYCYCQAGQLDVLVAGKLYQLSQGDVLAFAGDQAHSYRNAGRAALRAISVVIPYEIVRRMPPENG